MEADSSFAEGPAFIGVEYVEKLLDEMGGIDG